MNKYINIFDLIIISAVLFGPAVCSSIQARKISSVESADVCEFSKKENVYALITQAVQLFAAMLYLKFRGVNPFQFEFHITGAAVLYALILFSVCGLAMDFITSMKYGFKWIPELLQHNTPILGALQDVDLPLALVSILNGFYEEFFFLIVWSYVEPKYSTVALILMFGIRVMIHTYQGFSTALAVGIGLGLIHYLLFTQFSDNLFIYVLSHIIADLFGLSFINLI